MRRIKSQSWGLCISVLTFAKTHLKIVDAAVFIQTIKIKIMHRSSGSKLYMHLLSPYTLMMLFYIFYRTPALLQRVNQPQIPAKPTAEKKSQRYWTCTSLHLLLCLIHHGTTRKLREQKTSSFIEFRMHWVYFGLTVWPWKIKSLWNAWTYFSILISSRAVQRLIASRIKYICTVRVYI